MSSRNKGMCIAGVITFVFIVVLPNFNNMANAWQSFVMWLVFMFYSDLRYSNEEMKGTLNKIHSELEGMRRNVSGN